MGTVAWDTTEIWMWMDIDMDMDVDMFLDVDMEGWEGCGYGG